MASGNLNDLFTLTALKGRLRSRVPGAMQRVALAKRCFAEPGPYKPPASGTVPALQRTASQELRAALRPGHEAPRKIPPRGGSFLSLTQLFSLKVRPT